MRSVAAVALRSQRDVKLMSQGQTGQGQPHALRFIQRDAHVLDEVFDEEARVEVVVDNPWAQIRQ